MSNYPEKKRQSIYAQATSKQNERQIQKIHGSYGKTTLCRDEAEVIKLTKVIPNWETYLTKKTITSCKIIFILS